MRQRNVFDSHEIPHLWAHQTQGSARNAQGNFYFSGASIYSYGGHFEIARLVDCKRAHNGKVVFFTNRTYSVTTAKHIHHTRGAIPIGYTVFYVDNLNELETDRKGLSALVNEYRRRILLKVGEGRKARGRRLARFTEANILSLECNQLIELFALANKPTTDTLTTADWEEARRLSEQQDARDAAISARRSERQHQQEDERAARYLANREAWLAGASVDYRSAHGADQFRLKPTDPTMVQSSRGAEFPLEHARRAFDLLSIIVRRGENWFTNGHSIHVGHYKIDNVTHNGFGEAWRIQAGCHSFTWSEVQRFMSTVPAEPQPAIME